MCSDVAAGVYVIFQIQVIVVRSRAAARGRVKLDSVFTPFYPIPAAADDLGKAHLLFTELNCLL